MDKYLIQQIRSQIGIKVTAENNSVTIHDYLNTITIYEVLNAFKNVVIHIIFL